MNESLRAALEAASFVPALVNIFPVVYPHYHLPLLPLPIHILYTSLPDRLTGSTSEVRHFGDEPPWRELKNNNVCELYIRMHHAVPVHVLDALGDIPHKTVKNANAYK